MQQKTTVSTINLQTISYNSLQIGDLLGHGGYGDVYKATWHGTEVAIKELHLKTLSKNLQEEFNHESHIMAQCQFPNIIGLYGICDEIGHKGFVMEYMPRGSLRAVLEDKSEEISWDVRWTIAIDIGKGLNYLHRKSILHRDLKSLNILLTADYHAKICDFGLSKIKLETSSSSTKSNKAAGTTRWMAPELLSMDDDATSPTKASDIYSYGMVLWEISSREIPYKNAKNETIASMWIMSGKKESIPADCPKAYGEIIKDTWLEPDSRPGAEEVVTNLTKAKPQPSPVLSKKPQKIYVEKSWHFDSATERKTSQDCTEPYQLLEATDKDKQKVISFYQHHPVQGYEVGSVKVIYNRDFNQAFELQVKKLQHKDKNPGFTPKWDQENNSQWRAETNKKFEELANPHIDSDYPSVKILPLWHGTKRGILDSIFKTGYANLATTDSGFFGKGLYGAHEAEYSYRVYGPGGNTDGILILNWVASFSAYPVIDGDMYKLTGKGNHQNYDAHFAPVVPEDFNNKNEVNYYPCKPNQKNIYTELVTFDSSACLPRFLVELQSNKPQLNTLKAWQTESSKNIITNTNIVNTTSTTTTTVTAGTKNNSISSLIKNSIFSEFPSPDETTQKDLESLLKWVTEGHLIEVEKLLQKNPQLVFSTGTVTDLSNRTFKNITVFQYAVWALDIEMWDVILNYLDKPSACTQLQLLEACPENYSQYGANYDITPYNQNLDKYINTHYQSNSESDDKRAHDWKNVGGSQRQFPAWLVYAMCEVGTEVAWVKNDLKNIKVMRQYDKEHLKWWFSSEYYSVTLSDKWAWAVERGLRPNGAETWRWFDGIGGYMFHDKKVGQSIKSTRNEALNSLKIRLDQPIINSSSEFQKQPSIGTNFFTIYSPQKPTLKSNSIISPQQQEKQNKLTKALLIGDIELVKTLENQGASFSCPDHDGCYPLVAAVYGCNLELVKYIEAILQTEALEQWEKVDVHHFSNILQSQMPSVLPQNPTHGELGRWYEEFKDASWCPFYDREILKKMDCTRWTGNGSWSMEVRAPWLLKGHVWEYMTDMKISGKWGHGQDGDPRVESSEYFRGMLHCPSIKIHEEVVKAIQEQLSDLENYIHIKAGNHSNIKNKF